MLCVVADSNQKLFWTICQMLCSSMFHELSRLMHSSMAILKCKQAFSMPDISDPIHRSGYICCCLDRSWQQHLIGHQSFDATHGKMQLFRGFVLWMHMHAQNGMEALMPASLDIDFSTVRCSHYSTSRPCGSQMLDLGVLTKALTCVTPKSTSVVTAVMA